MEELFNMVKSALLQDNPEVKFINDYHTVFDFGEHKGLRIMDVPQSYLKWVVKNMKDNAVVDAIKRIARRRGVTSLINTFKSPSYLPELVCVSASMTPIHRPKDIDPSMFGSFIEYLVKSHLKLSVDDQPRELLAQYGLEDLSMTGPLSTPTHRIKWIHASYKKKDRTVTDVCNLSFSHSILLGHYDECKARDLFIYVRDNEDYFRDYLTSLVLPIPDKDEQDTCDKISVGCVIGAIDMISHGSIVDIKCKAQDDPGSYRKQLFAYACLHYLRYGDKIRRCEIYNFITGKQFVMPVGDSCKKYAREFIMNLGSYCPEHVRLFSQNVS